MANGVPHIPVALTTPSTNRGVGFTHEERCRLGLLGGLPSGVLTLGQEAERVWSQLQEVLTDLDRNLLLDQLHYRNEVLYFKALSEHLSELMPVVYTPTVGEEIQRFSGEYRGQRGLYLSIDHPEEIAGSFETFGLRPADVDLIVFTDAEAILGIGDWGLGGIEISVEKLAPYTAGGGVDPRRAIAVSLDVGTDNEQLLNDPFYVGIAMPAAGAASVTTSSAAMSRLRTGCFRTRRCILRTSVWSTHAIRDRYSSDYCVFNDDLQGTGAVMAAVYAGVRVTGIPMRDQKVVVFGAGTAGLGIADQIRDAMVADGATVAGDVANLADRQARLAV